ncbi:MAG: hypothetical protein GWO11_00340 [Desulfuromonadales bacterium]|nr:hypothetical protein [Desulfuromonadales bacterium]NIR32979.1 hypothetical protein [Desulfuromonadales bacterium]NIS40537.1 hypothetical protein [Desulfuromonadales bacterium]
MPEEKPRPSRKSQWLKNIGLTCLFVGFALEMGAIAMNKWLLLKAGLFIFLMGVPLLILGAVLGRRPN